MSTGVASPASGVHPCHSYEANSPRMHLNLTGAAIHEAAAEEGPSDEPAPSIQLPNQDGEYISHIALDIGGSLIKLVYFSTHPTSGLPLAPGGNGNGNGNGNGSGNGGHNGGAGHPRGGRLHFVKFETQRVEDVIEFIEAKNLHRFVGRGGQKEMRVKATGGGAHKYADIFKEKLGLVLEKEDEMDCLVSGCNFLLRAIHDEAFTFENGAATFVPTSSATSDSDVYPYLLVNIGSGVSIIKVDGDTEFQRVSGSSLGGGTFWGLCRLLTKRRDFDDMLQLSARGNNANVDMLVGDIYGGRDYTSIGLSATTIASSFGKVVSQDRELEDYEAGDMAVALCRMLAYNIAQLAYLNATRYSLKRVFFGGFFIRGHPYTMETISYAIKFWSSGKMSATFLRHEGFLGAMGAFLKVNPMQPPTTRKLQQVRSRFSERFSMGAPFSGGEVQGPPIRDLDEKVDWVEKFVQVGGVATREAKAEHDSAVHSLPPVLLTRPGSTGLHGDEGLASPTSPGNRRMHLHVGVLHYTPSLELFPLLADPSGYEPNTLSITEDDTEFQWWLRVLDDQIPTVMEKAIGSEGGGEGPLRRAMACGRAMKAHLLKLKAEPGAYGCLGLAELLEMREDCLREFAFADAYKPDKERENQAALQVLHDLLLELDRMEPRERLLALVQGVLAANIFDWGARACVALYHEGTILDIYREARHKLSVRPWRVDSFDDFADRVLHEGSPGQPPFRRVMMFVDNAGADIVLGMIPFAREMLRLGCEVVMVANSLPAINDITVQELRTLLQTVSEVCPVVRQARQAAMKVMAANNGRVPPYPGLTRIRSLSDLSGYGVAANKAPAQRLLPTTPEQPQPDPADPTNTTLAELLSTHAPTHTPEYTPFASAAPSGPSPTKLDNPEALPQAPSQAASKADAAEPAAQSGATEEPAKAGGVGNGVAPPFQTAAQGPRVDWSPGSPDSNSAESPAHALAGAPGPDLLAAAASAVRAAAAAANSAAVAARAAAATAAATAAASAAAAAQTAGVPADAAAATEAVAAAATRTAAAATAAAQAAVAAATAVQAAAAAAASATTPSPGAEPFVMDGPSFQPRLTAIRTSQVETAEGVPAADQALAASTQTATAAADQKLPRAAHPQAFERSMGSKSNSPVAEGLSPHPADLKPSGPKLYVVANGQGSPCLDLRRIPGELADASVGVDLLIIEGMGRAVHTNYNTPFKCDSLKLAMIKTERLAQRLFHGNLYDCVCRFERGTASITTTAAPVASTPAS